MKSYVNRRIQYLDQVFNTPTSIDEQPSDKSSWRIAPNVIVPGNNINIFLPNNEFATAIVSIYAADGTVVYRENCQKGIDNQIIISALNLSPGNYIVGMQIDQRFTNYQHLVVSPR